MGAKYVFKHLICDLAMKQSEIYFDKMWSGLVSW